MDLQCILCIANSSYAVETPKDDITCDKYRNVYKKMKIWTCFPQNRRFRDQTGGRETISQNGSLPFKTGGLEHMGCYLQIYKLKWLTRATPTNSLASFNRTFKVTVINYPNFFDTR